MNTKQLISQIHEAAQQLGACDKFKGNETIDELVELLYSPQGREFCIGHEFPSLDTLRKFKKLGVEQYDIYIDAGTIRLQERENLFLIGNTTASIICTQTKRHAVYLMHGAFARIEAYNYALVHVEHDTQSIAKVELNNDAREI